MHGIREYNRKIASLKNTLKITGSMKMISSVKLQRFGKLLRTVTPFWDNLEEIVSAHYDTIKESSTLFTGYKEATSALIVVFTSDKGLCGRYNASVIKESLSLHETLRKRNLNVSFSCIGSKGAAFFKRYKHSVVNFYESIAASPNYSSATTVADDLLDLYLRNQFQEIYLVYTEHHTALLDEPSSVRLLPLTAIKANKRESGIDNSLFLFDESISSSAHMISTLATKARIHRALVESTVSEHEGRMSAMDTATTNCNKMIQEYSQLRNRARQAAITTELSEIISGKEALE